MSFDLNTSVGRLVSDRLDRCEVFERFGIDYCCGGGTPLGEACRAAGLDPQVVVEALAAADRATTATTTDTTDWRTASLADLTDHIVATHHEYMKQALPRLDGLMAKVLGAHGGNHAELAEVSRIFAALKAELDDHLLKEEQVLYPLIRQMEQTQKVTSFHCGSVNAPIGVMEHEHDNAGEALRALRRLTGDYTPPADACATFEALLAGLAAMERDLHIHIHKENNILHPRAQRLESSLAAAHAGAGKGND